jgi:hypothetical protein
MTQSLCHQDDTAPVFKRQGTEEEGPAGGSGQCSVAAADNSLGHKHQDDSLPAMWTRSFWPAPTPSLPGSGMKRFFHFKTGTMIRYFPMKGGLELISLGTFFSPKIIRELITPTLARTWLCSGCFSPHHMCFWALVLQKLQFSEEKRDSLLGNGVFHSWGSYKLSP